jgi:hypothetical protein
VFVCLWLWLGLGLFCVVVVVVVVWLGLVLGGVGGGLCGWDAHPHPYAHTPSHPQAYVHPLTSTPRPMDVLLPGGGHV